MIKKGLLNFTFYQIIENYGHIDGFTKDTSPKLNFFLLGVYYNLNIFQIYYSISFLKSFFFVYHNIAVKGLPSLLISTINLFKKKTKDRFLQYYSFGKWTFGLFSNWIYCKSFLNISKYPFLNRKIKTIPKIIVALNNNFFLEREVKSTYTSIITFAFTNSNYFDNKRYFAPFNTNSFISINFYLKLLYLIYDRSFNMKLKFFWSFDFLEKILQNKSFYSIWKIFTQRRKFFTPFYHYSKNYLKNRRKRAKRQNLIKMRNMRRNRQNPAYFYDPLYRTLKDRIKLTKIIIAGRNLEKNQNKKIFKKREKKIHRLSNLLLHDFSSQNYLKKKLVSNLVFKYFKLLLSLIVQEKKTDLLFSKSLFAVGFDKNNFLLIKLRKLLILKVFLRNWKKKITIF